jgi:dTDP-glucose 4,6-dehydratase
MAQPIPIEDLQTIYARTREIWSEARGQKIFMTGGTGFFGCWMAESFVYINRFENLGAHLTILTRNPAAFALKCPHLASDPSITVLPGDVRDFVFPNGDFRYVIHAATEASANQAAENPIEMLSTMLRGTERVLEFAAGHGTEKLLLTSSGAVYGIQPPSIAHVSESYAGAPNQLKSESVYAEGKRAAELLCAVNGVKTGIECKIARCFAFVGPHLPLDTHFAIGNFIRDAMRGDCIMIRGDGTPKRSYMYASDLAAWLWTILFRAPAMEAFNVGSDQAISILELAHAVVAALKSNAEVRVAQTAVQGADVLQYVPCVHKAEEYLGLRCEVRLDDAIRRTAAWYGHLQLIE